MSTDPTAIAQPTLSDALLPVVTPIAQQAAQQVLGELQTRLAALEGQFAAGVVAQAPVVEASVLHAGTAVLAEVEHDPLTQRVLVWGVVGAVLIAALAVIGFALLGNATANRWIGAAPAAVIAAGLWVSNAGVSRPKRTTAPAQVTP